MDGTTNTTAESPPSGGLPGDAQSVSVEVAAGIPAALPGGEGAASEAKPLDVSGAGAGPVGEAPKTPEDVAVQAEAIKVAPVPVEVPVAFADQDWESDALPEGFLKAYPKLATKIQDTLENLRTLADNNKALEELLREDPSDAPLKAAQKEWEVKEAKYKEQLSKYVAQEEAQALSSWEAEMRATIPDIFDFEGEKKDYPALDKLISLVEKGIDMDVAEAQVRKTFNLVRPVATPVEVPPVPTLPKPGPVTPPKSILATSKPRGSKPGDTTGIAIDQEDDLNTAMSKLHRRVSQQQWREG